MWYNVIEKVSFYTLLYKKLEDYGSSCTIIFYFDKIVYHQTRTMVYKDISLSAIPYIWNTGCIMQYKKEKINLGYLQIKT